MHVYKNDPIGHAEINLGEHEAFLKPLIGMIAMKRVTWAAIGGLCILIAGGANGPDQLTSDKRALAPVQAYVGEWRGVGQIKRGSNQGAWTETAEWSWRFEKGRAELVGKLSGDKYFAELRLQAGEPAGQFVLIATPVAADQPAAPQRFIGAKGSEGLVFTADKATENEPARISLRLVAAGDRMITLYEKRLGPTDYLRLAEVGATRKGSSFAKAVSSGHECVVTGGLGKIAVEYQGKTYYVCCTGCRDLFKDDPAGVLADYRQRKADEQAEKNK